jgi:hypothetical protein
MKLLGVNSDAKTSKGTKYGYLTGILYLAPADESGFEVCVGRSPGCTEGCLYTAGHGSFSSVKEARIRKTQWLFHDRKSFLEALRKDVIALVTKAEKQGLIPCIRLNGTSDLGWEGIARDLIKEFSTVQWYDYTKIQSRMMRYLQGKLPSNYHLTFSKSENNWDKCLDVLNNGGNIAAVFDKVPDTYLGYQVIDGDKSDLRFLDPKNVIVGLKAKGKARKDTSGFVIKV